MIKTLYPIFQKWSEKGSVYIMSDTHFGDSDCKLMNPDWPVPEEYIKKINNISKNDTIIHLGDVGNPKWIAQIKGYKVLIMGNHDKGRSNYERKITKFDYDFPTLKDAQMAKRCGDISYFVHNMDVDVYEGYVDNHLFDEVYEGPLFISDKIVLSHEPLCVTAGITGNPIAFNIHGHDHSGEYYNDGYHLNCAANIQDYGLVNLKGVIEQGLISNTNIKNIHREIIEKARRKSDDRF